MWVKLDLIICKLKLIRDGLHIFACQGVWWRCEEPVFDSIPWLNLYSLYLNPVLFIHGRGVSFNARAPSSDRDLRQMWLELRQMKFHQ